MDYSHVFHNDPETFVEKMRRDDKLPCEKVEPIPLDAPKKEGYTRFVCISDTHNLHRQMRHRVPDGDVLIHCGDFTDLGKLEEVEDFNDWLSTLPHKHKIVIAGNHELSFDERIMANVRKSKADGSYCRFKFLHVIPEDICKDWPKVLSNCTFLHDAEVTVNGIRLHGCSWNPEFGGWAFNERRGQPLLQCWNKIPEGIDILLTHSPPAGYNDTVDPHDMCVGDVDLTNAVQQRIKPKYHVYGHIHEAYGYTTDGKCNYINCTIVDRRHNPCNKPVIIDFPTPEGAEGMGPIIQH
uniref:Metallophosphoesterase MPPED2 n=1 Tax=Phallusia mammillata TaxID=59560 RepID=A0A6F9DLN9_9ASCI|nr:metallophosphoesterase MPPED2 [Phallusia mammillata]